MLEGPVGGGLTVSFRNGEATVRKWLCGLAISYLADAVVQREGAALLRFLRECAVVDSRTGVRGVVQGLAFKSAMRRVVLRREARKAETRRIGRKIFSRDKGEVEVEGLLEVEWEAGAGMGTRWQKLGGDANSLTFQAGGAVLSDYFKSRLVLHDSIVVDFMASEKENGEELAVVWSKEQVQCLAGEYLGAVDTELEVDAVFSLKRWDAAKGDYSLAVKFRATSQEDKGGWELTTYFQKSSMSELTACALHSFRFFLKRRTWRILMRSVLERQGWQVKEFPGGLGLNLPEGSLDISFSERGTTLWVSDATGETLRETRYTDGLGPLEQGRRAFSELWGDLQEELATAIQTIGRC